MNIGDKASDFSLPATDGKTYSLEDFEGPLVLFFTCNHCPYVKAYDERILALCKEFDSQGVHFCGICSNDESRYPDDGFEPMTEKSKELGFPYPYLHDASQSVARAYDAACTPEFYLFDQAGSLQYRGRLDDNHKDESAVTRKDLRAAIQAVMSGSTPEVQETAALGCSIKWKS